MKSENPKLLPPKLADWTEGHSQIGVFVRTRMGSTIEYVNDNLDEPGAREEIRGMLSPFLGDEAWPDANPPSDGKEVLRPHSRAGWWEVWSGEICIALLKPEDVAKFLDGQTLKEVPRVWIDEDNDEVPVYKWHVVVGTMVVAKYEYKQQAEYTAEAIRKSFPFWPSPAPKPKPVASKATTPKKALKCQECGKPAFASYWHPDGKTLEAMLCRKHEREFRAESEQQVAKLRKLGYPAPKAANPKPKPAKVGRVGSDERHRQGER